MDIFTFFSRDEFLSEGTVGVFVVNKDNVVNVLQIKLCWLMVKIE